MEISASLVRDLREKTGLGIMECKEALKETSGDVNAAIDLLRKKSGLKATKKSDRITAEGVVVVKESGDKKSIVLVEINCETDFVAKDTNFLDFVNTTATVALDKKIPNLEAIKAEVETIRAALVQKIGENIQVRNYQFIETTGALYHYVHSNNRLASIVELASANDELGADIAMHIVASNPLALKKEDISPELLAKEKEIFMAQSENSGKPKEILEKMVEGKLSKFLAENALLEQPFVKNPDVKINALLKEKANSISSFVRLEVGAGVEKIETDFASEVMAQLNK